MPGAPWCNWTNYNSPSPGHTPTIQHPKTARLKAQKPPLTLQIRDSTVRNFDTQNPYRRYSLDYVDEEADAQAVRRGIWAGEFVKPWEWRRGKRLDSIESDACTACDSRHKRLLKRPEK